MKKLISESARYWTLAACVAIGGTAISSIARAETVTTETVVTETVSTTVPKATPKATAKPKVAKPKVAKPKTTRVRGIANARILHAIKDGPAVDVYVDNKKVLSSAAYKSVSDYLQLSSGKHLFKITAEGKSDALLTGSVSLSKDKFFTLAVYGTPEKPLLLRVNETTGKIAEGKARVFVVHLAQSPAVDVTTTSTRTKAGYASFLKGVAPGKSRAKSASAGDAKLQVRADGKVVKEADAKIESGKRYAVFAVGDVTNLDLIVKPAAPNYVEPIVLPKPKKTATPKASPSPTP